MDKLFRAIAHMLERCCTSPARLLEENEPIVKQEQQILERDLRDPRNASVFFLLPPV